MSKLLLNYAGRDFVITAEEAQTVRTAMKAVSTDANTRTGLVALEPNNLRTARHLLFVTLGVPIVLTEEP